LSIDLHIHTTASDGTLSPVEAINMALDLGLRAISITDHDTINGSKEAINSGIPENIKFLTGVEMSTAPPEGFAISGSLHILGYGIDTDNIELNRELNKLQDARQNRNPQILSCLNGCGFDISIEEVKEAAGPAPISRPHIAQVMLEKGFVRSLDEAFDKYLGKGKPAYVDKYRIDYTEALGLIAETGGISVLAHPGLLNLENSAQFDEIIRILKSKGLTGIETYYSRHTAEQTATYLAAARRLGLLVTGGSDFHGALTPDIRMGSGLGDLSVPYELYEHIMKNI